MTNSFCTRQDPTRVYLSEALVEVANIYWPTSFYLASRPILSTIITVFKFWTGHLLDHIAVRSMRCDLLLPWSVGVSVCLSVRWTHWWAPCTKSSEPIEVSFGYRLWWAKGVSHVFGGSPDFPTGRGTFGSRTWACLSLPRSIWSALFARGQ